MTDTSGRPILVAGATGRQGGSVVRHLLERQLTVRALVRDPQSGRAKALAGQGIEIAQATWTILPVCGRRWPASAACTASRTTSR